VLAKHSKSFSLIDCVAGALIECSGTSSPCENQVEAWHRSELADVTAKVVIYEAFVEGKLEAPKHLARSVHDLYFGPQYEEFRRLPTSQERLGPNAGQGAHLVMTG
jgi:hypothetical protein